MPIYPSVLETLVIQNSFNFVDLQTACSQRKAAEDLMKISPVLTRLVLIDHEYHYEFRRDPQTGIIAEEALITFNKREWASVE